jgi:hypothetical protein
MTDSELVELARWADRLLPERIQALRERLPRWGDLYDLNGIVEGLNCACRLAQDEGRGAGALTELTAVAAVELLQGRAAVARARASTLSFKVAEMAELDQIISAGLRTGRPVSEIIQDVDKHQSQAQANGRPSPSQLG